MSVNYTISDIFNYTFTGTSTSTSLSANANTGLMYRDAANNDEVRLLTASASVGYILTTTATNTIGWQAASGVSTNTEFLVRPTAAQTISSSALSSFTLVAWGTEIIDTGANFATNVYTLPDNGVYFFSARLEWGTANKSNKGERHARIVVDPGGLGEASLALAKEQPNPNKSISFYQVLSIIYDGTAAETVGVQVSQDSGIGNDIDVESRFFGWRVT